MSKRVGQSNKVMVDHLVVTQMRVDPETVVASFSSKQSLRLSITNDPYGKRRIDGPVDAIKWDDIERLARVVRETLVRASIFDDSSLRLVATLESVDDHWNPTISLVASTDKVQEPTIHPARDVIPVVLDRMVRPGDPGASLLDVDLTDEQMQIVDAVTKDALCTSGGRALQAEVNVQVLGEPVAKVTGKLAPKPDRSDFAPEVVDLLGEFIGFHAGAEVLFFLDGIRGEVKLAFGRTQVDLQQITSLIMTKQRVDARVHRTINKSGAALLAFVSLKTAAPLRHDSLLLLTQ